MIRYAVKRSKGVVYTSHKGSGENHKEKREATNSSFFDPFSPRFFLLVYHFNIIIFFITLLSFFLYNGSKISPSAIESANPTLRLRRKGLCVLRRLSEGSFNRTDRRIERSGIISDIIPPLSKLFIHSTYNFPGFSIYSFGILWSKAILIVSIKIKSKQTTV